MEETTSGVVGVLGDENRIVVTGTLLFDGAAEGVSEGGGPDRGVGAKGAFVKGGGLGVVGVNAVSVTCRVSAVERGAGNAAVEVVEELTRSGPERSISPLRLRSWAERRTWLSSS